MEEIFNSLMTEFQGGKVTADQTIEITKYKNRAMFTSYDVKHKQVRLDEVCDLIRENREVKITEFSTGKDLTYDTLLMAIQENERSRPKKERLDEVIRLGTFTDYIEKLSEH